MKQLAATPVCSIAVDGQRLCGLTWMNQALWFSDAALEQVLAVVPRTGKIVRRVNCQGVQTDLTHLDGHLLQIVEPDRGLRVLDPHSGAVVRELANPRPQGKLCGIEATAAGLWMGYRDPLVIDLRKASDLSLIHSIPVDQDVAGVTAINGVVAFASYSTGQITLIDPVAGHVIVILEVDGNPTGLTTDGRWLWYCDHTNVHLRAIAVPGLS